MKRRLSVMAIVPVLVLSLAVPGTAAAAPPAASPGATPITTLVLDTSGHAVAGARVAVSIIEGGAGTASTVSRVMAESTTDTTGRTSVPFSPTAADRALAAANGDWLNLEAMILDPSGMATGFKSFSRYLGSQPDQLAESKALGQTVVVTMDPTVRDATIQALARAAGSAGPRAVVPAVSCINYRWEVTSTNWNFTKIAEVKTASDIVTMSFDYGSSADSNVDVGYRDNGGAWYIAGNSHVGTSIGQIFHSYFSSNNHGYVSAPIDYAFRQLFADCPTKTYMGHDRTDATGWHFGYSLVSGPLSSGVPARNPSYSITVYANQGWQRYAQQLIHYSVAVSIFGVTLGAQTGATSYAGYNYRFGSQPIHYIHGDNNTPDVSSMVFNSDT